MKDVVRSIVAIVALTAVFGFAYRPLMVAFASAAFPNKADGSLIHRDGKVVGSKLAAQEFTSVRYFHSRPSGTAPAYNADGTTFSNLGPRTRISPSSCTTTRSDPEAREPVQPGLTIHDIPVDAVATSGSGIDPDISLANAQLQSRRMHPCGASALDSPEADRRQHRGARLGFFGEPGVNVLELNLALERGAALMAAQRSSLFSRDLVIQAIKDSFPKLDPRTQIENPVMFIVELGSAITTAIFFIDSRAADTDQLWFVAVIAFWLWLTVLFANFAEAIAEGRGKAQANALRATRKTTVAHRRGHGRRYGRPGSRAPEGRRGRRLRRRDHPGRW